MANKAYVISAKAKADLKSIARYTIEHFGEIQSLKYAEGLKNTLIELSQQPEKARTYSAIGDQLILRYNYKAHVIFFHNIPEGIFIVRVLGGNMDHLRHL